MVRIMWQISSRGYIIYRYLGFAVVFILHQVLINDAENASAVITYSDTVAWARDRLNDL